MGGLLLVETSTQVVASILGKAYETSDYLHLEVWERHLPRRLAILSMGLYYNLRMGLQHVVYGAVFPVRVGQVLLDESQVAAQDCEVAVPHDLLQGVDVHARPEGPEGEGAAKGVGMAILDAGTFGDAF